MYMYIEAVSEMLNIFAGDIKSVQMPMEGLKRRLSFRKKKKDVKVPECSKPHQWQEDEKKVREGSCSFQVRVGYSENVFVSIGKCL